jgi:hypothetical protein
MPGCGWTEWFQRITDAIAFERKLKGVCDSFEMYDERLVFIKNRKPVAVL